MLLSPGKQKGKTGTDKLRGMGNFGLITNIINSIFDDFNPKGYHI